MNVDLIRQTVKYIEDYPEEWGQDDYGVDLDPTGPGRLYQKTAPRQCFAGHALILGEARFQMGAHCDARELLGLDAEQAYEIFEFQTTDIDKLKQIITEQTGIVFEEHHAEVSEDL